MLMALASTVAISVYFVLVATTRGRLSDATILYINYLAVRTKLLNACQPEKPVLMFAITGHLHAMCGIDTVPRACTQLVLVTKPHRSCYI